MSGMHIRDEIYRELCMDANRTGDMFTVLENVYNSVIILYFLQNWDL
jgi:hypothetical protein